MLGFSITVQGTPQGVYHNKLNSFESSIVVTKTLFHRCRSHRLP